MEKTGRAVALGIREAESRTSLWVTGATGFIGHALLAAWQSRPDWELHAVSLRRTSVEELNGPVDAVLHLAGLAHRMGGAPDS
jgi:nucleoside-diphosphate-sugar epimerase